MQEHTVVDLPVYFMQNSRVFELFEFNQKLAKLFRIDI